MAVARDTLSLSLSERRARRPPYLCLVSALFYALNLSLRALRTLFCSNFMHFGGGTFAASTRTAEEPPTAPLSLDTLDLIGSRAACPIALANAPVKSYAFVPPVVNSFNYAAPRVVQSQSSTSGDASGGSEAAAQQRGRRAPLRPSDWVRQCEDGGGANIHVITN